MSQWIEDGDGGYELVKRPCEIEGAGIELGSLVAVGLRLVARKDSALD